MTSLFTTREYCDIIYSYLRLQKFDFLEKLSKISNRTTMSQRMNKELFIPLNDLVMAIPATDNEYSYPRIHFGLNSTYMQMRQELISINTMSLQARQKKLRELLQADYLREDGELRMVQLANLNTQP